MTMGRLTIICIILIAISLISSGQSFARIDAKTCVGLWLFDEGKGDTAKDSSGNDNEGTLNGKPKWVKGQFGQAVEFNGSNWVSVPDSKSLQMTNQVTVMFFVRTEKKMKDMWVDRQAVVGKHYKEYEVGIYMNGQIHTYTSDGGGNYDEGIMTTIAGKLPDKEADWTLGKWYHIAWTLNGAHEIAYVNGIKIGEHDKAHKNTLPGVNPLEIGRRVGGSIPLTGAVDEVAIFNVTLKEEDIKESVEKGMERVLGILAIEPKSKLATTWGSIKDR